MTDDMRGMSPSTYEEACEADVQSSPNDRVRRVIARTVDDLPLFSGRRLKATTSLTAAGDESFIYWRYSTDRQGDKSEDRQVGVCQAYLTQKHPSRSTVFGDRGRSGTAMANRPGLQKLRAAVRLHRPKRVIVEDLDRLSRRLADLLQIHSEFSILGVELHDIQHGKLDLVHVMIRGYMGEEGRVRFLGLGVTGRRLAVSEGRLMHLVAYGFRPHPEDSTIHLKDEVTAAVVIEIFEMASSGMSMRVIARVLSARCLPPPAQARIERRGGKVAKLKAWNAVTVRDIVRSHLYIGFVKWSMTQPIRDPETNQPIGVAPSTHGEEVVVEMPELAIVERDLWVRANLRLTPGSSDYRHGDQYLFTRKARCALCGAPFVGGMVQGRPQYTCKTRLSRGPTACAAKHRIRVDHLEQFVIEKIFAEALDNESIEAFKTKIRELVPRYLSADQKRRGEILRRLERIDDILTRVYEDEREGVISPVRAKALRRGHSDEATLLEEELAKLRHESQYLAHIDTLDCLQTGYKRMLAELPFRPTDPEGVALAQSLNDVVASIIVHQPDATDVTRVEIVIDPFLVLCGSVARDEIKGLANPLHMETSFNAKKLWKLSVTERWRQRNLKVDEAARTGHHAISDADWVIAAPFFSKTDFMIDGEAAHRLLMDGMRCIGAEGGYNSHIPATFGDATQFRSAVNRFIYSGRFDDAVEALLDAGATGLDCLAFFDSTAFVRRESKMPRPDHEQAEADRAELIAEAAKRLKDDPVRLQCEVVAAILAGASAAATARAHGIKPRSAYYHWYRYIRGGVDRIVPRVEKPSKQRLSLVQIAKLRAVAEKGIDPARSDRPITAKVICQLVASMFDEHYSVAGLRILLRRNKFAVGEWVRRARREGRLPRT